ncbi:hypothetical protein [Maribacter chungangensis]
MKTSFKNLLKIFLNSKLQIFLALMLLYNLAIVYLLVKVNLWDFSQIKNTFIWFVSVAFLSQFQMNAIKKDGNYLKRIVFDNFKFIALVQFVVDFYTFSLITELIIIPVMVFIGVIVVFYEHRNKDSKVKNFLEGVLSLFGLALLSYAIFKVTSLPNEFLNKNTGLDFVVPILLTILFIPFLFFMVVTSSYENFFITLGTYIKNKRKRVFAKIIAVIVFNVRINLFQRWINSLYQENTDSYKGLILSLKKIFKMRRAERNPKLVNPRKGWSPYIIKDVLRNQGLGTGYYKESSYEDWYSCSDYLEIGNGFLNSNISYYITGKETTAKRLKLALNVNRLEDLQEAHEVLCKLGKILFWYALKRKPPIWLEKSLLSGKGMERNIDFYRVSIIKEDYLNKTFNGYELSLILSVLDS